MANNQMPHNTDAEAALLGCIMIDAEIQSDILEELTEEDFYSPQHQAILGAMKAVYGSRKPVDVVTLTDRLERDGKIEEVGGLSYITDLSALVPSAANYRQYFEIVRRDAVNRALIRAAGEIAKNSAQSPDVRDALAFAEKRVYDISETEDNSALEGLGDGKAVAGVIHKFESIQEDPNAFRGVETGFSHLDRITHGLQKGTLVIIAARPGVGKTSLAMNFVEYACLNKKENVAAVFSLEMPRMELMQRLLCSASLVSMEAALNGKLTPEDWKRLWVAGDKLQKSKIFIDDSSVVTPAEILSKLRRLKSAQGRLDLVMIDYIQLMNSEQPSRGGEINRQQEIASITRALKIMAKELDVPVIALSQLRRIPTKEAQLSDLRESGAIEQDADIVMFINSLEDSEGSKAVKGAVELNIAKHRGGSKGRIQLRFLGEFVKFIEVEDQGAPSEPPGSKGTLRAAGEDMPPQGGKADFPTDEPPPEEEPFGDGGTGIPLDE